MDQMVLETQRWLNNTYSNNPNYTAIAEDGQTGQNTFKALIRALQIELGGITVDGDFGEATLNAMPEMISAVPNPETAEPNNLHFIIQGSLWCKGYNPGGFTGIFGTGTEGAVKLFQSHAGITEDGIIRPYIMQGIMNTDGYEFKGTMGYYKHLVQQFLNATYASQIGLIAPNGVWERKSHKNLIKACQIEWGAEPIDGVFGSGTMNKAPTLSQNTSGWTASKKLLQCALTVNGHWPGGITGTFGQGTYNAVYTFQEFACLGADGVAGKNTWASLLKSCGNQDRTATACDTSTRLTAETANMLVNAGYTTVGRYLTNAGEGSGYLDKKMTATEISIMANAGLKVFPIYQTTGSSADDFTWAKGVNAAKAARESAKKLGFPTSTVIYFAVDYDVLTGQIETNILPYFRAIKMYLGNSYQVGVYGPRAVCIALDENELAVKSFVADMSSGFTGNIGNPLPSNWAYDQFAEIDLNGIGIDKCIESPRATAILASELTPNPVYCGGDDYRNIAHHSMVLGKDNIYRCSVCGYEVESPVIQDRDILNENDYRRVKGLLYAAGYYESLRNDDASVMGYVTPENDTAASFYYMTEKCLKKVDEIRSSEEYRSLYSYCDEAGNYYPEFADQYDVILQKSKYPDLQLNSGEISNTLMLLYYNNTLEELYNFSISVFAGYQSPIFTAVTDSIGAALNTDAATIISNGIDYIVDNADDLNPSASIPHLKRLSNVISFFSIIKNIDFDLKVGDSIVEIRPKDRQDTMNLNIFFDENNEIKKVESPLS